MKKIISLCTLLSLCFIIYGADQSRRQQIAQRSAADLAARGALQIAQSTRQKVAGAPFAHEKASPNLQQQINKHNTNVMLNGGKKR